MAAALLMRVELSRGSDEDGATIIVEVRAPYSPDILADMTRHAVTAVGAMFPEDDDADLIENLEASLQDRS